MAEEASAAESGFERLRLKEEEKLIKTHHIQFERITGLLLMFVLRSSWLQLEAPRHTDLQFVRQCTVLNVLQIHKDELSERFVC